MRHQLALALLLLVGFVALSEGFFFLGSVTPSNCKAGYFSPKKGVECKPCQPGSASSKGALSCMPCWDGYYSKGQGNSHCSKCPERPYPPSKFPGCQVQTDFIGCKYGSKRDIRVIDCAAFHNSLGRCSKNPGTSNPNYWLGYLPHEYKIKKVGILAWNGNTENKLLKEWWARAAKVTVWKGKYDRSITSGKGEKVGLCDNFLFVKSLKGFVVNCKTPLTGSIVEVAAMVKGETIVMCKFEVYVE